MSENKNSSYEDFPHLECPCGEMLEIKILAGYSLKQYRLPLGEATCSKCGITNRYMVPVIFGATA
jgi:hypothetical protein